MGGPVLVGSVSLVLLGVFALVWANRPGSSAGTGAFEVLTRSQVAGRTWGDPAAPVRIVAFEDFQCPFCAQYTHNVEPALATEFIDTGKVRYEFHHLAFLGNESTAAAEASECAVEQDQFWPYHDVLYLRQGRENSGVYTVDRLKAYGNEVDGALPAGSWDQAAFEACIDSGRTRTTVERLTREAGEVGARSTPTLMINGKLLAGVRSIEEIRQAIAAAQAGN
ncbi:MAG: DsbA family protein [Dehalococcoidia bacterium]|nr:DsbA family protein [Dehalococcoidia bacterium]